MKILQFCKVAASAAFIFAANVAFAQVDNVQTQTNNDLMKGDWKQSLRPDGVYDHVDHANVPLEWQYIREADILWKKRVWREIDSREKQNMAFRFPGDENSGGGFFIEILLDALKKGKIQAFSNFDDRFTSVMSKEQVTELTLGKVDTVWVEDSETGQMTMKLVRTEFNPETVTKFRIKEDWIIDRNVGQMVVRIIALAPLQDKYGDDGNFRASQAMFWLYYPDLRPILARYEVFNPENDVYRMTWDEFFEGRYFASKIIKVSNPFDATFENLGASKMEALYESQRNMEQLFNKEHDLWVY
ncbi:MAG: gliding motility protein GldN [Flavipsychrobacter sp.]|nr:gliding motility protein GldN [Flavipsychrobacter sp.]